MTDFGKTLDEMDVDAFFNIRDWVQQAIEEKGAKITDKGIGLGGADLGFELNGAPFGLTIKPRPYKIKKAPKK